LFAVQLFFTKPVKSLNSMQQFYFMQYKQLPHRPGAGFPRPRSLADEMPE
jgi:hypothetical protein